jgi:uncharacterized membrane protein YhaH (DUF805 family)
MGNLQQLYTTLDGRISRKTFWIGLFGLVFVAIVIGLVLSIVGLGFLPMTAMDPFNPATTPEAYGAAMRAATWGSLITFLIILYPSYAISIKRRQDRNNNGLDVKIYYGLTLVILLLQAFGIGYEVIPVPGVEGLTVYAPGLLLTGLSFLMGIFALYLLVVLGFLAGTPGTNTYGPDPLGG